VLVAWYLLLEVSLLQLRAQLEYAEDLLAVLRYPVMGHWEEGPLQFGVHYLHFSDQFLIERDVVLLGASQHEGEIAADLDYERIESIRLQSGIRLPDVDLQIQDFTRALIIAGKGIEVSSDSQNLRIERRTTVLDSSYFMDTALQEAQSALLPAEFQVVELFDVVRVVNRVEEARFERDILLVLVAASDEHELLLLGNPEVGLVLREEVYVLLGVLKAGDLQFLELNRVGLGLAVLVNFHYFLLLHSILVFERSNKEFGW